LVSERAYRFNSFSFRVCSNVPATGELIDNLLEEFRAPKTQDDLIYFLDHHSHGRQPFALYVDGLCIQEPVLAASMIDFVLADATTRAIESERHFLVLHAGAVTWGKTGILLPGPPDSGKTTLVAGMTRAGFSYMTDEAALVEPSSGLLHPFARPLAMDPESVDVIGGLRESLPDEYHRLMHYQYHVRPEDLREVDLPVPCPIGYVVAPAYALGADTRLERVSTASAVKLLVENSFNFEGFGAAGLRLLADVAQRAECYRLQMGNLNAAISAVADLVGAPRVAMASS
jgi:hypothetical protein